MLLEYVFPSSYTVFSFHFQFCLSDGNEDDIEESDSDDDYIQMPTNSHKTVKIDGREGDYQAATTVIDRYPLRPERLENMVLAQFATSYVVANNISESKKFDNGGCSTDLSDQRIFNTELCLPKHIMLKENLGFMRLRTFPQVLRYHTSKRKEGHEEQYSELLLFCHWRKEVTEFKRWDPKGCIEVYQNRKQELIDNKLAIFPGEQITDAIDTADLEEMKPSHIYDLIASQNVQDNDDDKEIGATDDPDFESFGYIGNLGQEGKKNIEDGKFRTVKLPSNEELDFITRKLVPEQMNALRKVVSTMKAVLRTQVNMSMSFTPLRLIVHGGAGVGKSSFIKAASLQAEKLLRRPGDDPNFPKVLICAPTGKAASLIGKFTHLL